MNYITHSEADTMAFAARLSDILQPGDTVLLHGDLGAGKSVFARGVARGLGVEGAMPSPTFTLMIPYEGKCKFYHFDLYRLNDPDEFFAAGLEEFIGGDGVAVVEWPEMAEIDPEPVLDVTIRRGKDLEARLFTIENKGIPAFDPDRIHDWELEETPEGRPEA